MGLGEYKYAKQNCLKSPHLLFPTFILLNRIDTIDDRVLLGRVANLTPCDQSKEEGCNV